MSDPLWADLLNSDWHDHLGSGRREERLENDAWLSAFLARMAWKGPLPSARERGRLRRLRVLLCRIVEAVRAGGRVDAKDIALLNGALAESPLARRIERTRGGWSITTAPVSGGIDGVVAELASSFASMLADGDPSRIRICANRDCNWVFYDWSRNRTRRWCNAAECGNLIKVRRFRERHRARRKLPVR
ncbi:MAG: CGNR zinc finger domain-containing protein [Acidobacteriota bacterium]